MLEGQLQRMPMKKEFARYWPLLLNRKAGNLDGTGYTGSLFFSSTLPSCALLRSSASEDLYLGLTEVTRGAEKKWALLKALHPGYCYGSMPKSKGRKTK